MSGPAEHRERLTLDEVVARDLFVAGLGELRDDGLAVREVTEVPSEPRGARQLEDREAASGPEVPLQAAEVVDAPLDVVVRVRMPGSSSTTKMEAGRLCSVRGWSGRNLASDGFIAAMDGATENDVRDVAVCRVDAGCRIVWSSRCQARSDRRWVVGTPTSGIYATDRSGKPRPGELRRKRR